MLNRQIKPPANTTKKTILRKDISTATTKKETYHSKACSSPTPTKITKQNKLIVIPPKTPVKLQKNIQTSSDSRMQTSSPTLKESKEKKDSPRFVRGVSMISKPRLKIPASLPNVLKKNISDSFESIKEEKKTTISSINKSPKPRQTPSPAINKEKVVNKEKNSPKFLDNDVLKTHLIDEEMTPVVEKNNFFSLLRENESLKEKLRHLEENQKTSEKQLLELKGKQKEYDLVLSKISVDSAEIKSPQFKTEQDILNTLFSRALAKKNFKKAINYLEDGADVNVVDAEGETPIFHSILHNQLAVTYFLKQHNANLEIKNKQGKTILHTVCELNDIEKVKCILDIFPKDNGVDGLLSVLEMKTISPEVSQLIANEVLFIAAKQNNVPLAAKALMKGADVNARDEKDEYEETALHKASYYKNLSMVKCLLRNKSDPTLKNKHGYTPLQVTNDVMIREQIARYTTTKTEIEIKSAAATVIQKHYRLFNTPKKLFREMSFLKEISFLRERSFPIIKGLMKQQRFDEVNELIELFSNPHVFRLRLKLDYYTAEMNLPFESFPKSAAEKKEDVSIVTKRFKL